MNEGRGGVDGVSGWVKQEWCKKWRWDGKDVKEGDATEREKDGKGGVCVCMGGD